MSINTTASSSVVESIVPVPLLLPGNRPTFTSIVVAGGLYLPAGAVLGIATSGANAGLATLSVQTATDGSQIPQCIMPMPLATFAADLVTPQAMNVSAYRTGSFNISAIFYDPSWSVDAIRLALLNMGLTTNAPGYSGG